MDRLIDSFRPGLFAGRQILVTGGSSGIGAGIARAFRDLGATVTATGVTTADCERANADPANAGVALTPLDVRDGAALDALMAGFERLDVLVTAAGMIRRDAEHDPAVFAEVIAVNLTGTLQACAAAQPKLAASGGSVVTIASMLSFFGAPRAPAYAASKGGVAQLTKSLAAAWAPSGVRVNAVAPAGSRRPDPGAAGRPERSRPILSRTPMGRWGTPEEVAAAAIFLASPARASSPAPSGRGWRISHPLGIPEILPMDQEAARNRREVDPLPPSPAEGLAARARRPERRSPSTSASGCLSRRMSGFAPCCLPHRGAIG
jgi:NAD(P)-dependent dehydrogenase (short-subunit alcohol dehydrogenase family)